jgi:ATP-binding cassette subfamily C protein
VIAAIRRAFVLLDRADRWRWLALAPLIAIVAILETAGAAAVVVLVRVLADPGALARLPRLARWLPGAGDPQTAALSMTTAVVIFYLVRNFVIIGIEFAEEHVIQRLAARISIGLLTRYLRAPYTFHLRNPSAALIQRASMSVETVVETMLAALVHMVSEGVVTVGLLALMAVAAPSATLAAAATIAVLLLAPLRLTRRLYLRWGEEERAVGQRLLADLHQSLDTIKEILVSGHQDYFAAKFAADRTRLRRYKTRRGTAGNAVRTGVETIFICAMLLAVTVLTTSGRSGSDVVSVLGLFAYSGFRIVPAANRIILHVNSIRFARAYVEPMAVDWLALGEAAPPVTTQALPPLATAIEFDEVSYRYEDGRPDALAGVRLSIARGESIGIVGPTGAGKTTLVDVLLGLLTPTSGRILVDGRDVRDALPAWQAQLGYVPQQVMLVDDTLRRNIAFGIDDERIDDARVLRVVHAARLDALVASVPQGLDAPVGERGVRLSGGERQRIAIARALYRDPAVLIFDEATSALDRQTEREIADAIDALRGERTVIVIAHRMATVRTCDRLVVLDGGRVVAQGRFDELLVSSGLFRSLTADASA